MSLKSPQGLTQMGCIGGTASRFIASILQCVWQARLSFKGALQKFLYTGGGTSGFLLFFAIFWCCSYTSPLEAAAGFLAAARLGGALPLVFIRSGVGERECGSLGQWGGGHRALHRVHRPQVHGRQRVASGELVEPAQGVF